MKYANKETEKNEVLNKVFAKLPKDSRDLESMKEGLEQERKFYIKSNILTVGAVSLGPLMMMFYAEIIVQQTVLVLTLLAYVVAYFYFKKEYKLFDFTDEELETFLKKK